jgi:hypothetical protein
MEMTWRKSSYSSSNGGACIEVGVWRKSSYSSGNGGNCVEVGTAVDTAVAAGPWRKSSYSSSNGGDCVETAMIGPAVAVRDTKDAGHGPVLRFPSPAWAKFTTTLK